MSERFDDFFLAVCKQSGGIQGLLSVFLSFLRRRTDFFHEMDPGDKMGFPPGVAVQMLLREFKKQQEEHWRKYEKKDEGEYRKKVERLKEMQREKVEKAEKEKKEKEAKLAKEAKEIKEKVMKEEIVKETKQVKQQGVDTTTTSIAQQQVTSPQSQPQQQPQPHLAPLSNFIPSYNGGTTSLYTWSQQSLDLTLTIPLAPSTKAKHLSVLVTATTLSITNTLLSTPILSGTFLYPIKSSDSTWLIQSNTPTPHLILSLQKQQDRIWSTILQGDQQIDTSKVENSKKLQEFDEETRMAIEKLRYDQKQKMMGLPTSDEIKQREVLEKAWNAEGSPFKGTKFQPGKINMQGFKPE